MWLLLVLTFPCLAGSIVFKHVTVIDGTGAPPRKNFTVAVTGDRISAVAKDARPASGAHVIDGRGKYLIPGLWDMHAHISRPEFFFPLFVANGITGVREMFTAIPMEQIRRWRSEPMAPEIIAPGFLDGPLALSVGPRPGAFAVANELEARLAVRVLRLSAVDFLKVYASLPREAYFAILDEARKLGLPVAGHVPEEISVLEASEAGQRSQEHLIGILQACSTRERELRAERISIMNSPQLSGEARLRLLAFPPPEGLVDAYSEEKAAALFRVFVKNHTWHVPTLALYRGWASARDDWFLKDPRRKYVPSAWTDNWDPKNTFFLKDLVPQDYEVLNGHMRILLERYKKLVGDMKRAGVEFLAGTDTSQWNPALPGFSLHDELALLVEAGLTPMEALESATRNAARYLNRADSLGTIEPGKRADMVLLDADPLADIRNTQSIRAVVLRGRLLDDRARLELLRSTEEKAKITPM